MALDGRVTRALSKGHLVDIATTGRKTGETRRIELVFHNIDGRIFISGKPDWPRSWIANLKANPSFTFHLKGAVKADLPATARVVTDLTEREELLVPISAGWGYDLPVMVASAPLVEVTFD